MHVGRMVPTNLETNCNAHGPQPRRFFPFLFVVFSFSFHVFFYYYSLFLSCLTTSFHHLFVYRHFFSLACAVCLSFFLALCLRILKLLFFRFCVCVCFSVTWKFAFFVLIFRCTDFLRSKILIIDWSKWCCIQSYVLKGKRVLYVFFSLEREKKYI